MKKSIKAAAMAGAFLACMASGAQATPIVGGQLFATGGEITMTINKSDASYTDIVALATPTTTVEFGSNKQVGQTFSIGSFAAGTELIFQMIVTNTLETFFAGAGKNNIDGLAHATIDFIRPGVAVVGFEDIFGGGDFDYNDLTFTLTGGIAAAPVPEPTTVLLFGVGLLGLAAVGRKKLQN